MHERGLHINDRERQGDRSLVPHLLSDDECENDSVFVSDSESSTVSIGPLLSRISCVKSLVHSSF